MTATITTITVIDHQDPDSRSYVHSEEFQCNDRPDEDRINDWIGAVVRRFKGTHPRRGPGYTPIAAVVHTHIRKEN